jgi:hypothetical protein
MKKPIVFLFALLFVLAWERPSRTQEAATTLSDLKHEAISEVDKWRDSQRLEGSI